MQEAREIEEISRLACVMTSSDNEGAGSTWGLQP